MNTQFLLENLKNKFIKERLPKIHNEYLEEELFFLECNPKDLEYVLKLRFKLKSENKKILNKRNSSIYYLLGITDDLPNEGGIDRTPTTMPDIDYDTDGRDAIKSFLTKEYGLEHTTLIGTYGALKTKGAVKDIIRVLEKNENSTIHGKNYDFEYVNNLTKKFEVIKRTDEDSIREYLQSSADPSQYDDIKDYNSELAYFYACLEADETLQKWFNTHHDVKTAVIDILGNVKSMGIHAGGIIVSRGVIPDIAPLLYDEKQEMFVTQPEMSYVEESGLIKYDFLGLKTLGDLNRCLRLVNKRHNKNYNLSTIPMNDDLIFDLFRQGKTESIFQFNTHLSISILTPLYKIRNIIDLAIITSIARPGPLKMKMDKEFIDNKNNNKTNVIHPSLEPLLEESYGILCFQESIIQIAKEIGDFTGDEAVNFMKALSKKQADKVKKYVDKLKKNAIEKHNFSEEQANTLYDLLFAFAQYGFNKSHAVAYACVSYISMWFKHYYPAEWYSAVLSGTTKDDFKILYPKWKAHIQTPDINLSKLEYVITPEDKVIMPLSDINGVGDKAAELIIANQPYSSFDDFLTRVPKASKEVVVSLVFGGAFDSMRPDSHYSQAKWRKELAINYYRQRAAKASGKLKEAANEEIKKIANYDRGQIMMKEIQILNFTSFDYHTFFYTKMTQGAVANFGQQAVRPEDIQDLPNGSKVVVGGGVGEIKFQVMKKGADKGKEMVRLQLMNEGQSCDITIFARTLAQDDKGGGTIRALTSQMPIIVLGKINEYLGKKSVIYEACWILSQAD